MADASFSCGVAPLGVVDDVKTQTTLMNHRVDETLTRALDVADRLTDYTIANLSFNVDPTAVQTYALSVVDNTGIEFQDVDTTGVGEAPTIGPASIPIVPQPGGSDPAPPSDPPPVQVDAAPQPYTPTFEPKPVLDFGDVPHYGDLTSGIPAPDLFAITLPTAPDVDFGVPFTGTKPVFTAEAPDAAMFNYTEQAYNPLLVNEIKTTIQAMLAGTTGLPRVVEDALWQRQAEREAEQAAAATQDAFYEMSQRGFTLPNGVLNSKLMQVRQNSQNQTNSLARDVMIQVHNVLVDQLKFGVAQGIALENVWVQLYTDVQNRRLQAAQVAVNIAISVYNALVAQYQAQSEVYKTEAAVYASLIQAELAKLQAYSEEIRAQQLIGELNQQQVAIYTARLQAIETNIRAYLADIQAYGEKAQVERVKLDAFRTTIEVEQTKLNATQQAVNVWTGKLQGQSLIQQAAQTRTQTYLGMVQARRSQYEMSIEQQRAEVEREQANTARFVAQVQGFSAKANALAQVGQIIVSSNAAKVQKYAADSQWTSAYNTALAEKIRMINAANAQNTDLALKNGEINVQNALSVSQLREHALAQGGQVLAQMTSSLASNVNMHLSASDSSQFGASCNWNTSQSF